MNQSSCNDYLDLIDKPYIKKKTHPWMSLNDRAAQFAPFAALNGHAEAIVAQEVQYQDKKILDNESWMNLQSLLYRWITSSISYDAQITYFKPILNEEVGLYFNDVFNNHAISYDRQRLYIDDGSIIPVECIYSIEIVTAEH